MVRTVSNRFVVEYATSALTILAYGTILKP